MSKLYHVAVVSLNDPDDFQYITGEPTDEQRASHIERGVNINLDHEEYYTTLIEAGEES